MRNTYIFLLTLCAPFLTLSAQSNCSEANSYIVYALSHSESALNANNVTHAKHFAERSREAFLLVQKSLKNCQCDEVDDLVYDAIDYLAKAEKAEKLDDAYYYAHKGKQFAEATIEKLNICTVTTDEEVIIANADVITVTDNTADDLMSIEAQQDQLEQQQRELKLKQLELQQQLAEKKSQELNLKKEALIEKLELTVSTNIETFNSALKACDCEKETLNANLQKKELQSKSINDIKGSAITILKELTSNYMQQLADCTREED
jgi:hypothetical protein